MVDAATLIQNIQGQALVGATGAVGDIDRIVRYLNKAYLKLYGKLALNYPFLYEDQQDVVLTNGVGVMSPSLYSVSDVFDAGSNFKRLEQKSTKLIRQSDPGWTATGSPSNWDRLGIDGITAHPLNSTTLSVWGCANPAALTANSTEAQILIPPVHHDTLEWETLWTIAYDERDKLVGSELQFTRETADDCYNRLAMYLDTQLPPKERRVKPVL